MHCWETPWRQQLHRHFISLLVSLTRGTGLLSKHQRQRVSLLLAFISALMPQKSSDHQPASHAHVMSAAERTDLLRMLQDIDTVELSLDTEHVMFARGMETYL